MGRTLDKEPPRHFSRRKALSRLAALGAYSAANSNVAFAQSLTSYRSVDGGEGPTFTHGGPNAELYGVKDGFPIPDIRTAMLQGSPWEPKYRVGAFSHLDKIYSTRRISRAAVPWIFKRSNADLRYIFQNHQFSPAEYVSRNPVTGLLIAKEGQILFEHYQYGRTDQDRLLSQSMVKSIIGILIGIAIADGAIKSIDDTPETYVPGFKGTEYGRTPIRDLLHMSSGVDFGEQRDGGHDLNRLWRDMVLGFGNKGTVKSITQFDHRIAPPGTRFFYASIEPDVLGLVLHYAVNKSASEYLQEKVWHPIGAEADATWLVDAEGLEVAHFGFNAVLRDYARLGRLLAHDGSWDGVQIIPERWMLAATTTRPSEAYLAPGRATPMVGYGYLLWLLPGTRRQFALLGQNGQRICIDPKSKLVMVHTALDEGREVWHLWSAVVELLA